MQILKRLFLLTLLPAVILSTLFSIVLANRAVAIYDPTKTTVAEAAYSFQSYVALTANARTADDFVCGKMWTGTIDSADVTTFRWFQRGSVYTDIKLGTLLVPDGTADYGENGAGCNANGWLAKALSQWGWGSDYGQFLDDTIYEPRPPGSSSSQATEYVNVTSKGDESRIISNAINTKYYGGQNNTPQLTDAIKYWIYLQNFVVGCGASTETPPGDYTNADANNRNKADNDDNTNHFWTVIDDNGTVQDTIWKTTLGRGKNITTGYGVLPNASAYEANCGKLAELLRNKALADAFAKEIEKNPENKKSVASVMTSAGQNGGGNSSCGVTGQLSWLACPVTNGLADFARWLGSTIGDLLYTAPESIFTPQFKEAWNSFRNIGLALVLIAGLVMVISQAFGLEILDAYTIRKLLPRLAIVMIGMAISWPLLQLLITFFNDIGLWARDLILGPFEGLGYPAEFDAQNMINSVLEWGLVGGALVASGLLLGWAGILSLLATVVLALVIGLIVLALRQTIIVTAVLLAPLAIAAYVLPGTQKLWAFWKNTLLTSLVMFPIIMAFLAGGEALSRVSVSQSGNDSLNLMALLVFFAPYFMLPFAFKMAGGLMSTIFSLANDKNRGLFDRLKKGRGERIGRNIDAMKKGTRFTANAPGLGSMFNERSKKAYEATQTFGLTKRSRANRRAGYHLDHAFNEAMRIRKEQGHLMADDGVNEPLMKALKNTNGTNDAVRMYLTQNGFNGKKLSKATIDEITSVSERLQRNGSKGDVIRALTMHNITTGSGYKDEKAMLEAIADASNGDAALATRLEGVMRGEAKQVGRTGLGGSRFGPQNATLRKLVAGQNVSEQEYADLALSSFLQTGTAAIAQGRPEDVRVHTDAMQKYIEALRQKQPTQEITLDDGKTRIAAKDLADKLTAQLQNLADSSREYGGLDRSIISGLTSSDVGMDGVTVGAKEVIVQKIDPATGKKVVVKENVPEYSQAFTEQRSRYGTIPGSANDPNMPKPEPPKPAE